jgi:hypothetical protein
MKIDYDFNDMIKKFILIYDVHKGQIDLFDGINIRNFRFGRNKPV